MPDVVRPRSAKKPRQPKRPQVGRWGNSLAVRIPADLAAQAGLQEGTYVNLKATAKGLAVTPEERTPSLDELLEGMTPRIAGGEKWGGPMGKERL